MNAIEAQIAKVLPDIFAAGSLLTVDSEANPITASGPMHDTAIPEGQRKARLTSLAGAMRRAGFDAEAIGAALHVVNRQRCQPMLTPFEVEQVAASIGRYAPAIGDQPRAALMGLTLEALARHRFPDRKVLLTRDDTPVFREGHIGQIYAERGFGKTWMMQTLALIAAAGGEALGFKAPQPCRVLHVDGEMASLETQDRFGLLCERLNIAETATLTIIGADWQDSFLPRLDTQAGQEALEPFIEAADMVFLDNRSCLFDPKGEKDASAWQAAQDWLLSLRRRGKAVMLAHHSNRMGGARGHSKAEDPMNLLIKLMRPEDYSQDQGARFDVTFDKARGAYGAAVAPFTARLTIDGWQVEHGQQDSTAGKLRAYLRLADNAQERPRSASAAIRGARIQKAEGLRVWADLLKRGEIAELPDGFALRGNDDH